jgi:hypothetical protein
MKIPDAPVNAVGNAVAKIISEAKLFIVQAFEDKKSRKLTVASQHRKASVEMVPGRGLMKDATHIPIRE